MKSLNITKVLVDKTVLDEDFAREILSKYNPSMIEEVDVEAVDFENISIDYLGRILVYLR